MKERVQDSACDQVASADCPAGAELGWDEDEGKEREFNGELCDGRRAEERVKKDQVEREGRQE